MRIRAPVDKTAAVLRQRLEALASQLAELESLRDRVDWEENRRGDLRKPTIPGKRISSEGKRAAVPTWRI